MHTYVYMYAWTQPSSSHAFVEADAGGGKQDYVILRHTYLQKPDHQKVRNHHYSDLNSDGGLHVTTQPLLLCVIEAWLYFAS